MTVNDVESICRLTVELTKLRQNECKHLCIENFAPELFGRLIRELDNAERGFLPAARNLDWCPTCTKPYDQCRCNGVAG